MMKTGRIVVIAIIFLLSVTAALYYYMSRSASSAEIQISTNPWVGFTPFIYAQEKGWLEETPFRFMWLVDLTDNARLYQRGFTQGFTATQYELLHFKSRKGIKPVFLIDHSSGADAIVSNKSIDELRSSKETVYVYLERGSLNENFFEAFVREYGLGSAVFQQIDASQKKINTLEMSDKPVIIISYSPYLSELLKKGFKTVASTKTMKSFYVIDALFMNEEVIAQNPEAFIRLKELMKLAIDRFRDDPKEYYETIHKYLEGQTYEEFMESTEGIEWFEGKVPQTILTYLQHQNIQTDRLLP